MKIKSGSKLPKKNQEIKSLTNVLDRSEQVKGLVEECGDELTTLNTELKQELAEQSPLPGVENALEKSVAVENKVLDASEKLAVVNRELQHEISERQVLEHQLASALEQEESARHAAFHDPLTGLPNRLLFNDRLEHGLAQAKRHGWMLALMFVDLDDFKIINDSYGHDTGDAVLQTVAARLKENTRGDDTVSRHGGDEFLYLLMEMKAESDIARIAAKIIESISEPCVLGGSQLVVNASIGIAIFPQDGTTVEVLLKNADRAMYRAKREKLKYSFTS